MAILAGSQLRSRAVDGTRQLLDAILKSEEAPVDWLEAQLALIK